MSVFVSVEDRDGEPLVEAFEADAVCGRFPRDAGNFLRYAGAAEDASFNLMQAPGFMAELEAFAEKVQGGLDDEGRKELGKLMAACRKWKNSRYAHLRFYSEGGRE